LNLAQESANRSQCFPQPGDAFLPKRESKREHFPRSIHRVAGMTAKPRDAMLRRGSHLRLHASQTLAVDGRPWRSCLGADGAPARIPAIDRNGPIFYDKSSLKVPPCEAAF
jgi:hypothetical protein